MLKAIQSPKSPSAIPLLVLVDHRQTDLPVELVYWCQLSGRPDAAVAKMHYSDQGIMQYNFQTEYKEKLSNVEKFGVTENSFVKWYRRPQE